MENCFFSVLAKALSAFNVCFCFCCNKKKNQISILIITVTAAAAAAAAAAARRVVAEQPAVRVVLELGV
jgi:hypothetical protein